MKKTLFPAGLVILMYTLGGCHSTTTYKNEQAIIEVRDAIDQNDLISIKDDVKRIEYIPLETTEDCFISNPLSLCVSEDFIFVFNGKNHKVLQFDRTGKFVKQIGSRGNGPEEFRSVSELAVDNDKKQLYIFQYGEAPLVFSFDGEFQRKDSTLKHAAGMMALKNGKKALKGIVMSPVTISPWLISLQDRNGVVLDSVSPFPKSLNDEVCYMKEISFMPTRDGALAFTSCNDTIYRMNADGVKTACVLNRQNSDDYYTNIADITKLQSSGGLDSDINVFDFFETDNFYYFRIYKGDDIYIQRYSKADKMLLSQLVPKVYGECSVQIPGNNVVGLSNDMDGGVPFWPEFSIGESSRAQLVTPYMIATLQEKGVIKSTPQALQGVEIDDNPIIIVYTFN